MVSVVFIILLLNEVRAEVENLGLVGHKWKLVQQLLGNIQAVFCKEMNQLVNFIQ